jgi:hypothetical protein
MADGGGVNKKDEKEEKKRTKKDEKGLFELFHQSKQEIHVEGLKVKMSSKRAAATAA